MGRPLPPRRGRFKNTNELPRVPYFHYISRHPAPLPQIQMHQPDPNLKSVPAKPFLKASKIDSGIDLSWSIPGLNYSHADIITYEIFAYAESPGPVSSDLWKKIGSVSPLPLPMACKLQQLREGYRYHFAIRAKDCHGRYGPFSRAVSVLYTTI